MAANFAFILPAGEAKKRNAATNFSKATTLPLARRGGGAALI
jgi:hypothetical protein